jgi:leucyl-tRNA synthetase
MGDRSYYDVRISELKKVRPEYKDYVFRNTPEKQLTDEDTIKVSIALDKMSKSKFNVINPDDIVEEYGSDCFRLYEMFLGPIEHSKPWDTKGIDGVSRFLRKFWSLFFDTEGNFKVDDSEPSKEELKILHTAIKKVTEDIERFSFNTCVSAFMVAVNDLKKINSNNRNILEELVRLIAPFAPHIAEELWEKLGKMSQSLTVQKSQFPQANEAYLKEDSIKYPIAINGKTRAFANFPADATKDEIEKAAIEIEDVQKWTEGKTIRKIIVVPNRMVNIVVG